MQVQVQSLAGVREVLVGLRAVTIRMPRLREIRVVAIHTSSPWNQSWLEYLASELRLDSPELTITVGT